LSLEVSPARHQYQITAQDDKVNVSRHNDLPFLPGADQPLATLRLAQREGPAEPGPGTTRSLPTSDSSVRLVNPRHRHRVVNWPEMLGLAEVGPPCSCLLIRQPVFQPQARNVPKIGGVVGHQGQILDQRHRRDH
jgi:hypothetical protein